MGESSERLAQQVRERGVDFNPDDAFVQLLQADRAEEPLLSVLKSSELTHREPFTQDVECPKQDSEALLHLHQAAQLNRNSFHPREAEPEFRAAVSADPSNHFVHLALARILASLGNDAAAKAEVQIALNSHPETSAADLQMGEALCKDPPQNAASVEQFQKAIALAPSDEQPHYALSRALDVIGDKEGAAKEREIGSRLARPANFRRIRVGGKVMEAKTISKVPPEYPREAKAAHIEGVVRILVLVGKDGAMKDMELISGDPTLAAAAMDAVLTWRYQPTRLNRQPVEVETEVDVNFKLK